MFFHFLVFLLREFVERGNCFLCNFDSNETHTQKNTNKQPPEREFIIAWARLRNNDNTGGSLLLPVYFWVYYC